MSSSSNPTPSPNGDKTLTSLSVVPPTLDLAIGGTQQLSAMATYKDGSSNDISNATAWTSSNPAVASVNSDGDVTALASGTTTITADSAGIDATSVVTVGVNITTWHGDAGRSGLNSGETALTPQNVNTKSFGKLFSYVMDGYDYGQPLYMAGVKIGGQNHNVIFAATEKDSVYAFDADSYGSGTPLWQVSLLNAGESPLTAGAIQPYEGVTSTPVIDPATQTMYVVSVQKGSASGFFRLHALDLATGAEKFGGPVVINASVPGTNSDSVNGILTLDTTCIQRAALLLTHNAVVMGFGGCHSGWVVSYDATSLAQLGVFNMSPNTDGYGTYLGAGGVWMGGGGPAADSLGNVYVTTGNGPYDGDTAFGDSVMKFDTQLHLLDHFTPYNYAFLQCKDTDLAAGGLLLIPGSQQALAGGKEGKLYLVNTDQLGGEQANDAGAAQTLWFEADLSSPYSATCTDNLGNVLTSDINSYEIFGTAAFFNNTVYLGITPTLPNVPAPIRQFAYVSGQLTPGAVASDSIGESSYGSTPFVSANGTSNGVVWMLDHGDPVQRFSPPTAAILRAYDASNVTSELYNSSQNSADTAGFGIKFTAPAVANGKVFFSTARDASSVTNPAGEIDVYGLK